MAETEAQDPGSTAESANRALHHLRNLGDGVRAFECAFSVRTSSFVHGLMTRRAVFAFTVLAVFAPLTVLFKALGIIQVLHLNAAHIGMRCGNKKAGSLTYQF